MIDAEFLNKASKVSFDHKIPLVFSVLYSFVIAYSPRLEILMFLQGDFEKLHDFKMFLKHLQTKTEDTTEGQANGTVITGSDGVTKGHVVFSRYANMEASSSCLDNGAFLSIGHAGYNSEVSE